MSDTDNMRRLAAEEPLRPDMARYALTGAADEIDRLRGALRRINNLGQSAEPDHWNFTVHARNIAADAIQGQTE